MSIRKIVLVSVMALGLAGASATAAMAATPTPTPTVPAPAPVTANWTFDIQQSHIGLVLPTNVNRVEGAGLLPMNNWRDIANPNPAIDTFRQPLSLNSVTILHSTLPLPVVNTYTCSVTFNQTGRFRIIGGTGTGANLTSVNGQFVLDGMASYPLLRNRVCVLQFVSPVTILRATEFGQPVLGVNPTFTDFSVQGRARVTRNVPVIRPFAPTVTPTVTVSPSA